MNKQITLSREKIIQMIPHGAGMCMLDSVLSWNESHIVCESFRLADNSNPMSERCELQPILLVEYAAQAAAVHAALLNSGMGKIRPAYIGAIKNIDIVESNVKAEGVLLINAECALHSDSGAIYEFSVSQLDQTLICGKLILSQPTH